MPDLQLSADFLSWLITEAKTFELGDITEAENDDASDSDATSSVGDIRSQIAGAIEGLSEREQAELVALAWTGRAIDEDQPPEDFEELVALAVAEHVNATSDYLLGMPLLPDYLSEGAAHYEIDLPE